MAGIGGGGGSSPKGTGSTRIYGGKVNATGDGGGAGIGGNTMANSGYIQIFGGEVTARSTNKDPDNDRDNGAGIGGGAVCHDEGGEIDISGGTIVANGGDYGAGIGNGSRTSESSSSQRDGYLRCLIKITGGNITARGHKGAAIGAGYRGSIVSEDGEIRISGGNLKLSTYGNDGAACAIGSGYDEWGKTLKRVETTRSKSTEAGPRLPRKVERWSAIATVPTIRSSS